MAEPAAAPSPGDDAVGAFSRLAGLVLAVPDSFEPSPAAVVEFAALAVSHCDDAALSVRRPHLEPRTVAATSPLCERVDALQAGTGEGPLLDRAPDDDVLRVHDLAVHSPWPRLAAAVVTQTPIRSLLGIRIRLKDDDRAVLTFYANAANVFDDGDVAMAAMFAAHLSLLLRAEAAERKVANLETALETSRHIGAAMGILMARELTTFEQAFDQLRSASQRVHRKLRDVAYEVIDTGELPS